MDKGYYVIIESSEIFTSGIIEIVKSGLSQKSQFFSIHYRKDLNLPHPIECIIVGNGLGVEMSLLDLLVYIKSLKLAIPVICIPEMITSKMAKQLFTEKLLDGILHRDCTREELIEGVAAATPFEASPVRLGRQGHRPIQREGNHPACTSAARKVGDTLGIARRAALTAPGQSP